MLEKSIPVRPEESRLVLLLLVQSFCMGLARFFTRTPAYTLFLIEFDAQNLPYIYIGISIIVSSLSFLYLKIFRRVSFITLLAVNLSFLLSMTVLIWLGLVVLKLNWLVFVLPLWYDVLWTLTGLAFWKEVGQLFNTEQGERLFGLFSAGDQLAQILAGFLAPVVLHNVRTVHLFLIVAVALLVMIFLLFAIAQDQPLLSDPSLKPSQTTSRPSIVGLFKQHYVVLIFIFTVITWIEFMISDNIFYTRASAYHTDETHLAAFFEVFSAVQAMVVVLFGTFLSSRILVRYGVSISVFIHPIVLMASVLVVLIYGKFEGETGTLFLLAIATHGFEYVFLYSINQPIMTLMYQPLTPDLRIQVQTIAEGIVYPLAMGITGVFLLYFTKVQGFTMLHLTYGLTYGLLGLLLVRLILASFLAREYSVMVKQPLTSSDDKEVKDLSVVRCE